MASLIALAGFMGAGKSSVGRTLAQRLGWSFVELDREIERSLGVRIADSFRSGGETAFRAEEATVLRRVLTETTGQDTVLSLGGGALESADSRRQLKEHGTVVLLDVSGEKAWDRVAGSERPLAQDKRAFHQLYDRRRSGYEEAADWVMPTDNRKVKEIVDDLVQLVRTGAVADKSLWIRRIAATGRPSLIVGGPGAVEQLRTWASKAADVGATLHVVTDSNVVTAWGAEVCQALGADGEDVHVIEAGEHSKSVAVLERCWEWLAGRNARREDIVVALGGGVVGDLAGFAAATYHRGIRLWQVPTSLLSQVDSSVGGKTAVNLSVAKNLVGAFHQPELVVIDPGMLRTLPEEEFTGALGEVVKHALLSSPEELEALEQTVTQVRARDSAVLSALIKRNVWLKASVVEGDERESGKRASLNLGHTTAHALETVLGYGTLNHGQAVALGLLVSLAVSEEALGLDAIVRGRTKALLSSLGLDTTLELPTVSEIIAAAAHDKKASAGSSGFVGLRSIGEPVWGIDLPSDAFERALGVIAA